MAAPTFGQTTQRRASMVPTGVANQGKCTVEVVVDGIAEVEVRGDNGILRNVTGQPPQWRRFECAGRMPVNPADFQFNGVDGRGTQQLVRDPRNGGAAVVRIEDRDGGAHAYTFDVTWSGVSGANDSIFSDQTQYPANNGRRNRARLTNEEAVQLCQDAVRQRASERFGSAANVAFESINMDDNAGARDRVVGTLTARNGRQRYGFSCDVNTNNGRILSVQLDNNANNNNANNNNAPIYGDRSGVTNTRMMRSCEQAVTDRVRNEGYNQVRFGSTNVRGDRIVGSARADRSNGADSFDFSCAVNQNDGTAQLTTLNRR